MQIGTRGILSVTTATPGTNWVQLPSVPCSQVVIYNESGETLRWRYCTTAGVAQSSASLPILDGTAQPIRGLYDASQVEVKRDDDDDTTVTVNFLHEGN